MCSAPAPAPAPVPVPVPVPVAGGRGRRTRVDGERDLRAALRHGVGRIVVDSASGIARLAAYVPQGTRQRVMARVVPGVAAGGHAAIRSRTDDRTFGLSVAVGSALHAVTRLAEQPGLELTGPHCPIGSQIDT